MAETHECIVIGAGGFGSAAMYELARRGVDVVGLEQFASGHAFGSSHGETRIIRRAYFEHPDYVPLLDETYRMWRDLEDVSGTRLMELCGLLLSGPADGEAIAGARLSAERYNIPVETLDAAAAQARFDGFCFEAEHDVLFEADAGYLRVDACVAEHLEQAQRRGAVLRTRETVQSWSSQGGQVLVETDRRVYEAERLIITAGAWTSSLLEDLGVGLNVVRKPVVWFERETSVANSGPVFYFESGERAFYGLPGLDGRTVKVAEHSGGQPVDDANEVQRGLWPEDVSDLAAFVQRTLRGVSATLDRHSVCLYTMSPDGHFIVDQHPQHENVVFGAGFSGHGFKFSPVLGRALVDLSLDGRTEQPIEFLALDRLPAPD